MLGILTNNFYAELTSVILQVILIRVYKIFFKIAFLTKIYLYVLIMLQLYNFLSIYKSSKKSFRVLSFKEIGIEKKESLKF